MRETEVKEAIVNIVQCSQNFSINHGILSAMNEDKGTGLSFRQRGFQTGISNNRTALLWKPLLPR